MNNISDLHILKAFLSKKVYENYYQLLDKTMLAEQTKHILSEYRYYFAKSGEEYIDMEDFKCWFFHVRKHALTPENKRNYLELLNEIPLCEGFVVSELVKYYQGQKSWQKMQDLINTEGFDVEKLRDILQEYEIVSRPYSKGKKDEEYAVNLSTVFDEVINPKGLNWRLHCLNDVAPHLTKGDFVILVAYVDTGKTSFLASEVSCMAQAMDKDETVLWLTNEGRVDRILRRLCCATLERREQVIVKDLTRAQHIYEERMGRPDKVKAINIAGYNLANIKSLFAQYNPSLVVVDQLKPIAHPIANPVDKFEYICQYIRELSNEYCPVLGVAQASSNVRWTDSQGNQRAKIWLDLSDIYGSKIGVQGAAEIVIGIGRDDSKPNSRFVHVSKTKRGKYLQEEVMFDQARSLYLPGYRYQTKNILEGEGC